MIHDVGVLCESLRLERRRRGEERRGGGREGGGGGTFAVYNALILVPGPQSILKGILGDARAKAVVSLKSRAVTKRKRKRSWLSWKINQLVK